MLSLGARVVNVASNDIKEYFNGSIDELRIYNRVLTQSEAFSLYSL
ncbi:MAG: LamG-like jellyroll fold domain-containing protein [Aquirufa sp.]